MNRRILGMFINGIVFFSFTTTAWAAPNWWKSPNEPVQPGKEISSAAAAPGSPEKTQYKGYTPNYLALKLGAYLPQAEDVKDSDFASSFYGELAFGYYFDKNIAIELGVGYTKPDSSASASSGGTTSSFNADLTIIPITLGLKGSLPMGAFEPFAEAGIGLYYCKLETTSSVSGVGSASASETDSTFGYFLGLGTNFNVSPNVFLGLEGKYFWAKLSTPGGELDVDGINLTASIGYRY